MQKVLGLALAIAIGLSASSVAAEPVRANRLVGANLVSPVSAWAIYGSGTAHTNGLAYSAPLAPELSALAKGLGAARSDLTSAQYAKNVFDYVRGNIDTEFRFELGKGARGALIDQSGTALDQADLMVILLRQRAGVSASYNVGTIKLTAQQFGVWTGLVTGLDPVQQTFTVSARAACQILADGGIPALINDVAVSDCSTLSVDLTTVTMGHAWVTADGNQFDPAYKVLTLKAGIDLAAAAGCGSATAITCGAGARTAAMTGASIGTLAGSPTVQFVNRVSLTTQLNTYARSVEQHIRTNAAEAALSDLVGGGEPDPSYNPTVGAALPYQAWPQYNWSTVPDQFRVQLRLQYIGQDKTFFVDELSGRLLRSFRSNLYLDNQVIATTDCALASNPCATFQTTRNVSGGSGTAFYPSGYLKLTITHPYAAGAYANETIAQFIEVVGHTVYVVGQLGNANQSREAFAGAKAGIAPYGWPQAIDPFPGDHSSQAARALVHQTLVARMVGQTFGAAVTRHHTLGAVEGSLDEPYSSSYAFVSLAGAMSVNQASGATADREGIFQTLGALDALVEDSNGHLYARGTAATGFVTNNMANVKFVDVSSANLAGLLSSLTNYNAFDKSLLQAAAAQGYNMVLPVNGQPGCANLIQDPLFGTTGQVCPSNMSKPAFDYKTGSNAYLVAQVWKSGDAYTKSPTPNVDQENYSLKQKKYLNIDAARAALSLQPPPDISTGAGNFPESLSFTRRYNSDSSVAELNIYSGENYIWSYTGPGGQWAVPAIVGAGWAHNYQGAALFTTDAPMALGQSSGLDASAILAGLMTLKGLQADNTIQGRLTTLFTVDWMAEQINEHVVSIDKGLNEERFFKLPSGVFHPRLGSASTLTVAGAFGGPYASVSQTYGYSNLSFTYTDASGEELWFNSNYPYPASAAALSRWTNASGVRANFERKHASKAPDYGLVRVTNSFGRSLTFGVTTHGFSSPGWGTDTLDSVTDENGRAVSFARTNCAYNIIYTCGMLEVTLPAVGKIKYDYAPGADSPDPTVPSRPTYRLRRIYTPGNANTPFQTIKYDELFRVASAADIAGHVQNLYASAVFDDAAKVSEQVSPMGAVTKLRFDKLNSVTQVTNPLGYTATKIYDNAGRILREVTPEGGAKEYQYDIRGNQTRECALPKNWSSDVSRAPYPMTRANERVPRCKPASDPVTTRVYKEGATVWPCLQPKSCNRVDHEIDPRGARTDFIWSDTHGNLLTVLGPGEGDNRYQISYGYTPYQGSDGSTFYLLTSKTETVEVGRTVETTYAYDPLKKYTIKSQTLDPTGLNLVTCFKFDPVGNPTGVTDPRAGGTCP